MGLVRNQMKAMKLSSFTLLAPRADRKEYHSRRKISLPQSRISSLLTSWLPPTEPWLSCPCSTCTAWWQLCCPLLSQEEQRSFPPLDASRRHPSGVISETTMWLGTQLFPPSTRSYSKFTKASLRANIPSYGSFEAAAPVWPHQSLPTWRLPSRLLFWKPMLWLRPVTRWPRTLCPIMEFTSLEAWVKQLGLSSPFWTTMVVSWSLGKSERFVLKDPTLHQAIRTIPMLIRLRLRSIGFTLVTGVNWTRRDTYPWPVVSKSWSTVEVRSHWHTHTHTGEKN